ncbi:MAG: RNA polymerase-binding protein DksA [Candidatus Lambdaproteobacteria bacterium RIFOXYD1_FULL_56_27]|uniref:RNA polymerase-binding protein DksA n=1 Tax=Candidatus Lambdaproteobacteria bacterium RIFOXYD2_FULL_56_26 TaxID=1817773 RepID=A0A1F6GRF0_9PROT|nr:MAG: RNA polymerase-binding protein DksA [Candidatus Lambdaproteobacteria bacterium RIFOXYC1_FULL_56_13]OGH00767.1 MAG: RNA polymerase-binding protein DksA [Candidatus Lambdaproteobacteria bacterium RIFOXYD2_FULL_56_26]OGH09968.1 MAG: RNA polymerase-binding protein DksA [Candidatus Lambdaproteobacteria bacterium RIFOXYD1_FULL_56_27]
MEFDETSAELSPQEYEHFKAKLQEQLGALMVDSDGTVQEMQGADLEFPDPGDRATYEFERNTTLRIRDRERKLAKKVSQAIERLEAGTYNECEECGEPIGKKRLDARPVTTLCILCKESQEQQEHIRNS